jgi:hypothetical protein
MANVVLPDIRAISKLNGNNYQVWQFAVANLLELYDLLDVTEVVYHLQDKNLECLFLFYYDNILNRGLKIDPFL